MKHRKIKYFLCAAGVAILVLSPTVLYTSCAPLKNLKKLIYDYSSGAVALERVENAQYIPDMVSLLKEEPVQNMSANSERIDMAPLFSGNQTTATETTLSSTEFVEVINEYAQICNYSGAGKYLGYDIYEIKDEIAFVIEKVPAFNQWFRMPIMREEQGYISIPYYEGWAYYLEMDEETQKLSITRVCWSTRSSYYDFEKGVEVEDHADGTSFIQYEIMKINYYINGDGDEVVDCSIYAVGVDHHRHGGECNTNQNDYYSFEYMYLQNVKDKSLIKYHITAAERRYNGMDIRGHFPYGYRREFTLVSYAGYGSSDIEMLQIDQYKNQAVDFRLDSKTIRMLVDNIDLPQEDYTSAVAASTLMDSVCKHIVDNFELKDKWPAIYKESVEAYEIDIIEGPFFGQPISIEGVDVYVSCRGHEKNELEYSANADILEISAFDLKKMYSLSLALRSRKTSELHIIATDYQYFEEVEYNYPEGYEGKKDTYFRTGVNIDIWPFTLDIWEPGEYDLTCVLTVKEDGEDVIVFDTLKVAYLRQFHGLVIPDSTDNNGVTYSYTVSSIAKRLTITVTRKEL